MCIRDRGAASSAADRIMEKLYLSLGYTREEYLTAMFESFLLSMDVGHAYHPSKPNNYDPKNHARINEGVVIKMSSTQSYACLLYTSHPEFGTGRLSPA